MQQKTTREAGFQAIKFWRLQSDMWFGKMTWNKIKDVDNVLRCCSMFLLWFTVQEVETIRKTLDTKTISSTLDQFQNWDPNHVVNLRGRRKRCWRWWKASQVADISGERSWRREAAGKHSWLEYESSSLHNYSYIFLLLIRLTWWQVSIIPSPNSYYFHWLLTQDKLIDVTMSCALGAAASSQMSTAAFNRPQQKGMYRWTIRVHWLCSWRKRNSCGKSWC